MPHYHFIMKNKPCKASVCQRTIFLPLEAGTYYGRWRWVWTFCLRQAALLPFTNNVEKFLFTPFNIHGCSNLPLGLESCLKATVSTELTTQCLCWLNLLVIKMRLFVPALLLFQWYTQSHPPWMRGGPQMVEQDFNSNTSFTQRIKTHVIAYIYWDGESMVTHHKGRLFQHQTALFMGSASFSSKTHNPMQIWLKAFRLKTISNYYS